ncbi:protein teflon [Anastrepha obliqua]|uniref:protein teflon n=1 Tax=Anastrepha obliqua TaxID=95512 RepID=UPI002409C424|nr:protein teflon [Anastrepha obliqua]
MGSAVNELSDFSNTGLVKCGEIVTSAKQNNFLFRCAQCNEMFSQMAIFTRHLQWEHQGNVLPNSSQKLQVISTYTMEELLSNENGAMDTGDNELSLEDINGLITDEDDDTGIDSDVELENEIKELLTSIATTTSLNGYETEYSENDSGVESRNNTNENPSEPDLRVTSNTKKNQVASVDEELEKTWKNLQDNINTKQSETGIRNDETENKSEFDIKDNSNENHNSCLGYDKNACESTDDCKHVNYGKLKIKKTTKVADDNQSSDCKQRHNLKIFVKTQTKSNLQIEEKATLKSHLKIKDSCINKQFLFKCEDIKSNSEVVSLTDVESSDIDEAGKPHDQRDILPGRDIRNCPIGVSDVAMHDAETYTTLDRCEPYVIAEVDVELAEIKFSEEEISQMKKVMPEMTLATLKETECELGTPTTQYLSSYQKEYLDFNASEMKSVASGEHAIAQAGENENPLDLSFDKSSQLSNIQSEAISEFLNSVDHRETTTKLITEQVDKLLTHPSTFIDNPIRQSTIDCSQLQRSDSIDGLQLPPFSKFFKNTANTLKNTNGFLAQSTPKQKHVNRMPERGSPLRPCGRLNMNENCTSVSTQISSANFTHSNENNDFKSSIQLKLMKRLSLAKKKENKSKKRKTEVDVAKTDTTASNSGKKMGLEILSVDIIAPAEQTLNTENILCNGIASTAEAQTQIKKVNNFESVFVRQDVNNICKMDTYMSMPHAAADSTSGPPTTPINVIDYTPEDTLNQLKLEAIADENKLLDSLMQNSFNITAPLNVDIQKSLLVEENSSLDESMLSNGIDEEKLNSLLLRSIGLKIITHPNAEDGLKLEHLEAMRAKASMFAKIYADFKYLWKFSKGIKSYEKLELDFSRLMHRLNEHYRLELSITQTKRIVNLVSMWYMDTYHKWFIEKKSALNVIYYLNLFSFLPKTARRIIYCEECPRYFLSRRKYFSHRQKHIRMQSSCPYCQTIFTDRATQLIHTKVCTIFKCVECGCKFENAASLEYHLRTKHLLQCETCGQLCANAVDLDWHEHQYPTICGLCNRFFDSVAELQKHRQDSFHWDYTCRICEIFAPTATQMKQHLSICNGR